MWLADHMPDTRVWSLEYGAHRSFWRGAKMTISDHATLALDILVTKRLGRRPLLFVTHSLGGLIVKSILRASESSSHLDANRIADATRAVTYFATPNNGSWTASHIVRALGYLGPLAPLFRLSYIVHQLQYNNPQLKDLNDWYISFIAQRSPGKRTANKVYFETRGLIANFYPIVSRDSADLCIPDAQLIPIPCNHIEISKFDSSRNALYESTLAFIEENLPAKQPVDEINLCTAGADFEQSQSHPKNIDGKIRNVDAAIRLLNESGKISIVEHDGRKRMLINDTDNGESADLHRPANQMLNAALEPNLQRVQQHDHS